MIDDTSNNDKRLCELVPGTYFQNAIFAFNDVQVRVARNNKSFLTLRLRDRSGVKVARWFSPPDDIQNQLEEAQLVCVSGWVDDTSKYHGEIKLDSCASAPVPEDMTPYLQPLPHDHKIHRARFFDLIRSVQNPHCKELLKQIFDLKGETWQQFEKAPAAKSLHHGYPGGLLEHTGEVATLCDGVCATLPLDRDLLITAALLHDIGKLEEMTQGLNAGEYTQCGRLIGHVVIGTCTVRNAIDHIDNFPEVLRDEILHLILSHHGQLEFGAAKIPMFPEALILSLCDLMSARMAQCRELLEKGDASDFTKIFGWDTDHVYLAPLKRVLEQMNIVT